MSSVSHTVAGLIATDQALARLLADRLPGDRNTVSVNHIQIKKAAERMSVLDPAGLLFGLLVKRNRSLSLSIESPKAETRAVTAAWATTRDCRLRLTLPGIMTVRQTRVFPG